ncbi:MAG: hypothetical protein M5U26_27765 [Planctomycetota bacterium]|nr:hypothetical protein [Planctomycetota bacterium]
MGMGGRRSEEDDGACAPLLGLGRISVFPSACLRSAEPGLAGCLAEDPEGFAAAGVLPDADAGFAAAACFVEDAAGGALDLAFAGGGSGWSSSS